MTSRAQKILVVVAVVGVCGLFFLGILTGAAVMGYKAAMRAGNEAATIQNLKTVAAVEAQYFNTHNRTFANFDQLIHEELLSSKFSSKPTIADGYLLNLSIAQKPDGVASWYKITADPQDESKGKNHFYLDSDDERIRVNSENQAGPADQFQLP